MKEVKSPKKPLLFYYGIVLLVILVFNLVVSPLLLRAQVQLLRGSVLLQAALLWERKLPRLFLQRLHHMFCRLQLLCIFSL